MNSGGKIGIGFVVTGVFLAISAMLVTFLLNKRRDKSSREAYVKPEVARHEVDGARFFRLRFRDLLRVDIL